nr:hypothetical protein CFP56_29906 [Quercus suber]
MLGSTGVSRAATSSVEGVEDSRHSSGGGRVVDGGIDSSGPDEVKWDGSSRGNHWRTRRHHEKHAGRALCISEDALGGNGRRDSRACTRAKKRPRTGSEAVQLAQPPPGCHSTLHTRGCGRLPSSSFTSTTARSSGRRHIAITISIRRTSFHGIQTFVRDDAGTRGVFAQKSSIFGGKPNTAGPLKTGLPSCANPTTKRPFEPTSVFEEYDAENIDPSVHDSPTKKTKNGTFNFALTPVKSMAPPPFTPARANIASARTPLTAPAGRSPTKRGKSGISKTRRVSAPFTRIDPPFASRGGSTLPFSLDAALSGTLSTSVKQPLPSAGATIQESMPKSWYFDIFEDTPEEEAANLMEHSTLTLDLSSDDESTKKDVDERGKENIAPAGYAAPVRAASAAAAVVDVVAPAVEIIRKKIVGDEMDDGLRSPLSDLETDYFIPEGLDKENCVVLIAENDGATVDEKKSDAAPLPAEVLVDIPNPATQAQVDIVIFEDKPDEALATSIDAEHAAVTALSRETCAVRKSDVLRTRVVDLSMLAPFQFKTVNVRCDWQCRCGGRTRRRNALFLTSFPKDRVLYMTLRHIRPGFTTARKFSSLRMQEEICLSSLGKTVADDVVADHGYKNGLHREYVDLDGKVDVTDTAYTCFGSLASYGDICDEIDQYAFTFAFASLRSALRMGSPNHELGLPYPGKVLGETSHVINGVGVIVQDGIGLAEKILPDGGNHGDASSKAELARVGR